MGKTKDIEELKKNAEFMRIKLEESREAMEKMPIVMPYDNGGGQTGIRENPAFPAYEKLFKSYQAAINQINELSGKEKEKTTQNLRLIGSSKWKRA